MGRRQDFFLPDVCKELLVSLEGLAGVRKGGKKEGRQKGRKSKGGREVGRETGREGGRKPFPH